MPPAPEPAATDPEAERKRAWGRWLTAEMAARGLVGNSGLGRLLNAAGAAGRYKSGLITQWKQGSAGPSETACLVIAEALALPAPFVLRQAGLNLAADKIERQPQTDNPQLLRIRSSGLPAEAQEVLTEYIRRQDADLDERIADAVRLLKIGEGLRDDDGGRDGTQEAS